MEEKKVKRSNLYRHFPNPPEIIKELDKMSWGKYELARYMSVKCHNLVRLFTNPYRYMNYSHIQKLAVALDMPIDKVMKLIATHDDSYYHNRKNCSDKIKQVREAAERNRQNNVYIYRAKRDNKGRMLPEDNTWDYDI